MTRPIPPGPPFDLDVLADLHAGVYPPDVAAALRARVAADAEATAVLAALDATLGDLRGLRDLPPAPVPASVAARLDAAIAGESAARAAATPAPDRAPTPAGGDASDAGRSVASLAAARRARGRRRGADHHRRQTHWATGLGIAAAVAAAFTIGAVLLHPGGTSGRGMAGEAPTVTTQTAATGGPADSGPAPGNGPATTPPPAQPTVPPGATRAVVAVPHHLGDLLSQIDGSAAQGPLSDPQRMAACLTANDVADEKVLGVLPVSYAGQRAYAISLRTASDTVRILVVGPDCGADGANLLEEQTTTG